MVILLDFPLGSFTRGLQLSDPIPLRPPSKSHRLPRGPPTGPCGTNLFIIRENLHPFYCACPPQKEILCFPPSSLSEPFFCHLYFKLEQTSVSHLFSAIHWMETNSGDISQLFKTLINFLLNIERRTRETKTLILNF